jgi:hypothetical protein
VLRPWICVVLAACGNSQSMSSGVDASVDADLDGRSTLRVVVEGSGQGSVQIDAAMTCDRDCSAEYASGTQVALRALPAAGSVFGGWQGACAGSDPMTTVAVASDVTCTATFRTRFTLSVTITGGSATIASAPAGIACPEMCTSMFVEGTTVALTATLPAGVGIVAWRGDCSGTTASVTVAMTGDRSCEVELAWSSANWARTYGTNRDNRAYAAVATADGGYAAAGYSGDEAQGLHDGLVVKVDRAGAPVWLHRYGTVNKDELEGIVELAGGGYLAVGRTFATGRAMDAWIVRLDAGGNLLGQTTYGTAADETIRGIAMTSPTTAILVGEQLGTSQRGLVLGIDVTTGAVQWSKLLGTGTFATLDAVAKLGNGNVVAVGSTSAGAWLLELTPTGTVVRERTVGTNAAFTAVTANGTGWIAGGALTRSTGSFTDGWLVAFDATGAIVWQKTYTQAETVHDIAATSNGFAVAGQSQFDGISDAASGWLLGIDGIGSVRFERQYGSPFVGSFGTLLAVATGSGDRVLGAGHISGWGAGGADVWLADVDAMGAIGGATCPAYVGTVLTSTVATSVAAATTTNATITALTSPVSSVGAATLFQLNGTIQSVCFN